jgi:hypothetical protein
MLVFPGVIEPGAPVGVVLGAAHEVPAIKPVRREIANVAPHTIGDRADGVSPKTFAASFMNCGNSITPPPARLQPLPVLLESRGEREDRAGGRATG